MIASTGVKRIGIAFAMAALLAILLVSAKSQAQSPLAPGAAERSKLRILYAGHAGIGPREGLRPVPRRSTSTRSRPSTLQAFKEADTQGFDVTLLDWDGNDFKGPRPQHFREFSRPLMTLGCTRRPDLLRSGG